MPASRLQRAFLRGKLWAERSTPSAELVDLLQALAPKSTSFELRRLGSATDGGYVVPDDLDGLAGCISPGVFNECSFDLAVAELGLDVFMADASVDGPPEPNDRFHFSKLFLDTYVSPSTITLDAFCQQSVPGDDDLLLEMDIEGAEYRVLQNTSEATMRRFRIMVIEFHHLGSLFSSFGFLEISNVFRRLLTTHEVVHIHPNNVGGPVVQGDVSIPPVLEFTFLRKDRGQFGTKRLAFPNPSVDAPNHPELPDVALPRCWQRG